MGSRIVTPEDVLESLMNDGTIDAIRLKIINQLKANEELKNNTITMVEQSKVLNTPGAEKQTKRELFDALRRELETQVLEKASRAVWELILDDNGLGKEVSETVERVFCKLSGREFLPPPQLTTSDGQVPNEEKVKREREGEKVKEIEMSESSKRKRTFSEMNAQGAELVANDLPDQAPAASDDGALPYDNDRNEDNSSRIDGNEDTQVELTCRNHTSLRCNQYSQTELYQRIDSLRVLSWAEEL